ncbi:unnamed protein product, partial [Amoebophrya sp. A25]
PSRPSPSGETGNGSQSGYAGGLPEQWCDLLSVESLLEELVYLMQDEDFSRIETGFIWLDFLTYGPTNDAGRSALMAAA